MFERPDSGERAVLVNIKFRFGDSEDINEFTELCLSAGVEVVGVVDIKRNSPDARYYLGRGKAEEIRELVLELEADVVLFNHSLSPAQERNLEQLLKVGVLDRIGVILDIFAQRASTFEGKLQVELAQLRHLSTRLIRGWTHLERQKGGIGLRGPGETQLETDRRLLGDRIRQINRRLEKVKNQRHQARRSRKRAELPVVSLVGYTNAGKSSLFNQLSGASVYTADKLFATLDPTLRRIDLDGQGSFILADTVGFIRQLPHELVAAFRATLEETLQANLLLHVIDAADVDRDEHMMQVDDVLASIGAEDVPRLLVYNKIDCLDEFEAKVDRDGDNQAVRVWVSAITGEGMDILKDAILERCDLQHQVVRMNLPASAGRLRASLYRYNAVREDRPSESGGWMIEVELADTRLQSLCEREGLLVEALLCP